MEDVSYGDSSGIDIIRDLITDLGPVVHVPWEPFRFTAAQDDD
jgi:hypothetical protein